MASNHTMDAQPEKGVVIERNCRDIVWNDRKVEPNQAAKINEQKAVIGLTTEFSHNWKTHDAAQAIAASTKLSRAQVEAIMVQI